MGARRSCTSGSYGGTHPSLCPFAILRGTVRALSMIRTSSRSRENVARCFAAALAGCVLAALPILPCWAAGPADAPAAAPATSPAMTEYRRKLEEYTKARAKFDAEANAYWSSIAQMRRQRIAKRRASQEIVLESSPG